MPMLFKRFHNLGYGKISLIESELRNCLWSPLIIIDISEQYHIWSNISKILLQSPQGQTGTSLKRIICCKRDKLRIELTKRLVSVLEGEYWIFWWSIFFLLHEVSFIFQNFVEADISFPVHWHWLNCILLYIQNLINNIMLILNIPGWQLEHTVLVSFSHFGKFTEIYTNTINIVNS